MNPIVLIPARLASTRLPGKPMALIDGKPMIVRVWRRAVQSFAMFAGNEASSSVVVACDSEEIADAIISAGGRAILTDPDLPSGSDRIYQALQLIDPLKKHDVVINIQGDMPTLDLALIAHVLSVMENPDVDIATLAAPITEEREMDDPAVVKPIIAFDFTGQRGRALYFTRSRAPSGDGPLYHHIGIYAYRRDALEYFVGLPPSPLEIREKLEQLRALEAGLYMEVGIVDTVPLGVDTPETLELAREWYKKGGI